MKVPQLSALARSLTLHSGVSLKAGFKPRTISRHVSTIRSKQSPTRFIFSGTVIATLGAVTILYYTNDSLHFALKHAACTAQRVTVVANATLRCFYHYKRALSVQYDSERERQESLSRCHKKCALITLKALKTNGGIYIKLGQHIGAMTYLLPVEWTETMVPLQDHCPRSSLESINEMFLTDLQKSIDDLFSNFDTEPIGVASLAQVHIAKLKSTGAKVAVKCQHPSLKEFVPLDVLLTQTVFALLDVVFPDYSLVWLAEELQSSIYVELDFNKEAENARRTSAYFARFQRQTALRIPKVLTSDERILIMEYVPGARLDNLEYLDKNCISKSEVSACLSHIFNNMIFTPGAGIHCDPHGGNLAVRAKQWSWQSPHNFEIVLYDHGLYRYPDTSMRREYAKFWLALLRRDRPAMQLHAKRFALINDEQFPLFVAALTGRSIEQVLERDITTSLRSAEEIRSMGERFVTGTILSDIMQILARIPRMVLLLLKTNDLTRYLDECLQYPLGPTRSFLIMTQYCAYTLYDEDLEKARSLPGSGIVPSLRRWLAVLSAWMNYTVLVRRVQGYDWYLRITSKVKPTFSGVRPGASSDSDVTTDADTGCSLQHGGG